MKDCQCAICRMQRAIEAGELGPGDHMLDADGQEWTVSETLNLIPVFVNEGHR